MIWMFAGSGITKLATAAGGIALLAGPLNNANTWVAGTSAYTPPHARHLSIISNAVRWRDAAQAHNGLVLDIERWRFTPKNQQRHPASAYRYAFQKLSSLNGKHWLVATPAFDLVKSVFPHYRGKIYTKFIQSDLAGRIAPYVDVYEIQAQGAEDAPLLYRAVVTAVAQQVHAANPAAIILGGLSANPSGHSVRVGALLQDIRETRTAVSGYWLNIPQSGAYCPLCGTARPGKVIEVLRKILG